MPYDKADGSYAIDKLQSIIIDSKYSQTRDNDGLTLIPPTLREFGDTFAQDLKSMLNIDVAVVDGTEAKPNSVFITLDKDGDYKDAAGRKTHEGYTLSATKDGVTIQGASPLGAWWATRTVLQQATLDGQKSIPAGKGVDAPGWGTRGMMLDCARHFYPKEFITDLCSYISFFKQNTFHIHLSDNTIVPSYTPENYNETYARFRLWSDSPDLHGLNKYRNESYTRDDFDEIQTKCAKRGVTVIPEIEAPGHCLPIVQWRPQIGYAGDFSLLNIAHPDTLPTMKTIWKEFLPWFHSKVVSIGADEYKGPEEDYKTFVNAMSAFIAQQSDKLIRIWGTFPAKPDAKAPTEVYSNITIQHWAYLFDDPYADYMRNNYSVINSDEMFYIVMKDGPYGRTIDTKTTFTGNPDGRTAWYPNIFNVNETAKNPPRNHPLIQGAIAPIWNDHGANTSVYSEAFYAWRDGIPALADKHWGGSLTQSQYKERLTKLRSAVPAQNLARVIPTKGTTILSYDLTSGQSDTIKDSSGNSYDAKSTCKSSGKTLNITPDCELTTPWPSKGRNYKLSLTLKVDKVADPTNATLVAGGDSVLMLTPNVSLFASGNYYRLNHTIPMGSWVTLELESKDTKTFASAKTDDGKSLFSNEEFLTVMSYYGQPLRWHEMAIEAPTHAVTGWTGELKSMTLTSGQADAESRAAMSTSPTNMCMAAGLVFLSAFFL